MQTAKKGIFAALIGFAVMLGAWLLVNTTLRLLSVNTIEGLQRDRTMFGFTCSLQSQAGTASGVTTPGGTVGGGTTPGGGAPGAGTCTPVASGACSAANLQNTCFGSRAETMSVLCNKESMGIADIKSGPDICENYGARSFSGGLFQINVFANGSLIEPRCANLGSKGTCLRRKNGDPNQPCLGWQCTINNVANFDYCMTKVFDPATNIRIACQLSNNGVNLQPWACSANLCNLGGTTSNFCKR